MRKKKRRVAAFLKRHGQIVGAFVVGLGAGAFLAIYGMQINIVGKCAIWLGPTT